MKTKSRILPACVYQKHGGYYLVKKNKWHFLGRDLATALHEYARRISVPKGSMEQLVDEAMPHITAKVKPNTKKQYELAAKRIKDAFAEFTPQQVKPKDVAQLKRALSDTPNMANRIISVLRSIFDYALESELVDSNPTIGIKRLEEAKRDRYMTDSEFNAIYSHANDRLQVIMDLAYITAQRIGDVLKIKRSDIVDEGILFKQEKTGSRLIVQWTPQLREVVERAKGLQPKGISTMTLLTSRYNKAPDYSSVKEQFDNARTLAGVPDVTMHDIRAKSLTDNRKQGNNATALAGHSNPAMTERYIRQREIPVVTGTQKKQNS